MINDDKRDDLVFLIDALIGRCEHVAAIASCDAQHDAELHVCLLWLRTVRDALGHARQAAKRPGS